MAMDSPIIDPRAQHHGRPLKVLHIGNIANNAYNIAKLQRRAGIEADVLCGNYYHIMGCPEWEDATFDAQIPDHLFPKWHKINLHGYARPEWFVQGPGRTCVKYLIARNEGKRWLARYYRLKLALTKRLPGMYFILHPDYFFAKKLPALLALPESLSERAALSICAHTGLPRQFGAHLKFAALSAMVVSVSLLILCSAPFLGAVALLVAAAYLAVRLPRRLARLVKEAPERSTMFAQRGIAFWSAWIGLPYSYVPRITDILTRSLGIGWFSRIRARLLLTLLFLPAHALVGLAISTMCVVALLGASPLFVLALCARWAMGRLIGSGRRAAADRFPRRIQDLLAAWRQLFPHREPLAAAELQDYESEISFFERLFSHYDVIQGYATEARWPLLCDARPFVAYEHGTLREIPFADNPIGKLTALAYRLSDHAFITNGDCGAAAARLGVPRFSATLHGIDDSKFRCNRDLRTRLLNTYQVSRLYLCPIRHDWAVKGTDQHIRALPDLVRRSGTDFRVIMIQWGEMVEQSKQLAQDFHVDDQIVWIEPLPKRALIEWIGAMDCVLDQIMLPHFGATAPEAMGCGVPVISSYEPDSTAWIVAEPAPILSAFTPAQIAEHLANLRDPFYHAEVSDRSLAWFRRNHSSKRLLDDHLCVYQEILNALPPSPSCAA
jgi:glycosyltransferase involved in cell wall biosynthesis